MAFEDDHERELHLRRRGYAVRRYTGAQLDNYPAEIVVELGEVPGAAQRPHGLKARPPGIT